jgi:TRAP transporter TAXI family solute receptor
MKKALIFLTISTFLFGEIVIGTGKNSGNYFKMGLDLKKVCSNLKISVKTSGGSSENLKNLLDEKIDLGFFQTDTLYSYEILQSDEDKSLLNYDDSSQSRVVAVSGVGKEYLFVLTKASRRVTKLSDLDGKRVIIGSKKSGSNKTANFLRYYFDVGNWDFIERDFANENFYDLKNGEVDAIFLVGSKNLEIIKNLPANIIVNDFYNNIIQKPFHKERVRTKTLFYVNSILAVGKNRSAGHEIKECISQNIVKLQTGNYSKEWKNVDVRDKDTDWYNLK